MEEKKRLYVVNPAGKFIPLDAWNKKKAELNVKTKSKSTKPEKSKSSE